MKQNSFFDENDRASFSAYFKVKKDDIRKHGAIDICLFRDLPLFIDPMLIFNSTKPEYLKMHEMIIDFFLFLASKSQKVAYKEIKHLLVFKEVKNTWLGYSKTGNCGTALREKFARQLYKDLPLISTNNNITRSFHIEKALLLYEGDGKDKISDMTTKLILPYLYSYTEAFTKKYIGQEMSDYFIVDFDGFNYETESFKTGRYLLPYVYNSRGQKEYVLLTPGDIVRVDDQAINRHDMFQSIDQFLSIIDNESLRYTVSNYLIKAVADLHCKNAESKKEPTEKEIKKVREIAFSRLLNDYPELYDYYVRFRESRVVGQSDKDLEFLSLSDTGDSLFGMLSHELESLSSIRETQNRIRFFKHVIEDRDAYKLLWIENKPRSEKAVQYMFDFVWIKTSYLVTKECNNGRGPADFNISYGKNDQTVVEFKLASNTKLKKVFSQIDIYATASEAKNKVIVVICFTEKDIEKYWNLLEETSNKGLDGKLFFHIDARQKQSASK